MRVARVVVDVPTRAIDTPFDYLIPSSLPEVGVGCCVLVSFGNRPVAGYVIGVAAESEIERLSTIDAYLGGPYFDEAAAEIAQWISSEYVCPLPDAVRLFTPPGGSPRVRRKPGTGHAGEGGGWEVVPPRTAPVDDRWVSLSDGSSYVPRASAHLQRAVLDALSTGPLRVAELRAQLGPVSATLKRLSESGAVVLEARRRYREAAVRLKRMERPERLTRGQREALTAISAALDARAGGVVLLDGVTGSGKTEVYLQAIERVLQQGRTACVLVPEISLTPQTVGRFRARFGDDVAVLHSRLSAGERFDQWDLVRQGRARIVVGARSALFAPLPMLGLIVIDEEHEPSYKQGSSPRYHARDVAEHMASVTGAALVVGSASPSMESLAKCEDGAWTHVRLPERATEHPLPEVSVVDMTLEFAAGNRSMFSRQLAEAIGEVEKEGNKAVLFLNRRGFAAFLLCRECGFVPQCDSCSTSMTYHEVGRRLVCHHCGATRPTPVQCPQCQSPYLRQFGAGTQRVESELTALFPGLPVVRMDADTTKGQGSHERALAEFESLSAGVLLGTQMIAKGLDYPDVTLVGVIAADTSLHLPDFRAGERTYQLLEQVAGRAGRGAMPGRVVFQTYCADHRAVRAAALHDPEIFYREERQERASAGMPPYGRLANVLIWGRDERAVAEHASTVSDVFADAARDDLERLGPSPAVLPRLKGMWRWHLLIKGPAGCDLSHYVGDRLRSVPRSDSVSVAVDVDPQSLL